MKNKYFKGSKLLKITLVLVILLLITMLGVHINTDIFSEEAIFTRRSRLSLATKQQLLEKAVKDRYEQDNTPVTDPERKKDYIILNVSGAIDANLSVKKENNGNYTMVSHTGNSTVPLNAKSITYQGNSDTVTIPFELRGEGTATQPYIVDDMNKLMLMFRSTDEKRHWQLKKNFKINIIDWDKWFRIVRADTKTTEDEKKGSNIVYGKNNLITDHKHLIHLDGNGYEIYFDNASHTDTIENNSQNNRAEVYRSMIFGRLHDSVIENTTLRFSPNVNYSIVMKCDYKRGALQTKNVGDGFAGLLCGEMAKTTFKNNNFIVDSSQFNLKVLSFFGPRSDAGGLAVGGFLAGNVYNSEIYGNNFSFSGKVTAFGGWGFNVGALFGLLGASKKPESQRSDVKFLRNFISLYQAKPLQVEGVSAERKNPNPNPQVGNESGRHIIAGRTNLVNNNTYGNYILHDKYTNIKGNLLDYFFSDEHVLHGPMVSNKSGKFKTDDGDLQDYYTMISYNRVVLTGDTVEDLGLTIEGANTLKYTKDESRIMINSGANNPIEVQGNKSFDTERSVVIMPNIINTQSGAVNVYDKDDWNFIAGFINNYNVDHTYYKNLIQENMPGLEVKQMSNWVKHINIIGRKDPNVGGRNVVFNDEMIVNIRTSNNIKTIQGMVEEGGKLREPKNAEERPLFIIGSQARSSGVGFLISTLSNATVKNFDFISEIVATDASKNDSLFISNANNINIDNMHLNLRGKMIQKETTQSNLAGFIASGKGVKFSNITAEINFLIINAASDGKYGSILGDIKELSIRNSKIDVNNFIIESREGSKVSGKIGLIGGSATGISGISTFEDVVINIKQANIQVNGDSKLCIGGLFGSLLNVYANEFILNMNMSGVSTTGGTLSLGYFKGGAADNKFENTYVDLNIKHIDVPKLILFNDGQDIFNNVWLKYRVQSVTDHLFAKCLADNSAKFFASGGNIIQEVNALSIENKIDVEREKQTGKYFDLKIENGTFVFNNIDRENQIYKVGGKEEAWLEHGDTKSLATFRKLKIIEENSSSNKKFSNGKKRFKAINNGGKAETGKAYVVFFASNAITDALSFKNYANAYELLINTLGCDFVEHFPMEFNTTDKDGILEIDFDDIKGFSRPIRDFKAPIEWNNVKKLNVLGTISNANVPAYYRPSNQYYGVGLFESIAKGYVFDGGGREIILSTKNYVTKSDENYTLYAGFFAAVNNGTIKNLNVSIVGGFVTGYVPEDSKATLSMNLAGFVARNEGTIQDVNFKIEGADVAIEAFNGTQNAKLSASLFIVNGTGGTVKNTTILVRPLEKDATIIDLGKAKISSYGYAVADNIGKAENVVASISKNAIFNTNQSQIFYDVRNANSVKNSYIAMNAAHASLPAGKFKRLYLREGGSSYLTIANFSVILEFELKNNIVEFSGSNLFAPAGWSLKGQNPYSTKPVMKSTELKDDTYVDIYSTRIQTTQHFNVIADYLNRGYNSFEDVTFLLVNDIKLDDKSVINVDKEFKGTLKSDGSMYSIQNIKGSLFPILGQKACLENVSLEFTDVNASSSGYFGLVTNENRGIITNVSIIIGKNAKLNLNAAKGNSLITGYNKGRLENVDIKVDKTANITFGNAGVNNIITTVNDKDIERVTVSIACPFNLNGGALFVNEQNGALKATHIKLNNTLDLGADGYLGFVKESGTVTNAWLALAEQKQSKSDLCEKFSDLKENSKLTVVYGIFGDTILNLDQFGITTLETVQTDNKKPFIYLIEQNLKTNRFENPGVSISVGVEDDKFAGKIIAAIFENLIISDLKELVDKVQNGITGLTYTVNNNILIDEKDMETGAAKPLFTKDANLNIFLKGNKKIVGGVIEFNIENLENIDAPLFNSIGEEGGMTNIVFNFNDNKFESNNDLALIALENKGTIHDIEINVRNTKIASVKNVGGIVVENVGSIIDTAFVVTGVRGDRIILDGDKAAAIATINKGDIINSLVEMSFVNKITAGKLKGDQLALIACVQNDDKAKIVDPIIITKNLNISAKTKDGSFAGIVCDLEKGILKDVKQSVLDIATISEPSFAEIAGVGINIKSDAKIENINRFEIKGILEAEKQASGFVVNLEGEVKDINNLLINADIIAENTALAFNELNGKVDNLNIEFSNIFNPHKLAGTNVAGFALNLNEKAVVDKVSIKSNGTLVAQGADGKVAGLVVKANAGASVKNIFMFVNKITEDAVSEKITLSDTEFELNKQNSKIAAGVIEVDSGVIFKNTVLVSNAKSPYGVAYDTDEQYGVNQILLATKEEVGSAFGNQEILPIVENIEKTINGESVDILGSMRAFTFGSETNRDNAYIKDILTNTATQDIKLVITTFVNSTIDNISDLEELLEYVNDQNGATYGLIFKLGSDIVIDKILAPIAHMENEFDGVFDGEFKTITISDNGRIAGSTAGLFGTIGVNGVVKNLNLEIAGQINDNAPRSKGCGGLVGYLKGTIEKIAVNVNINAKADINHVENYTTGLVVGVLAVPQGRIKDVIIATRSGRENAIGYTIKAFGDGSDFSTTVIKKPVGVYGYTIKQPADLDITRLIVIGLEDKGNNISKLKLLGDSSIDIEYNKSDLKKVNNESGVDITDAFKGYSKLHDYKAVKTIKLVYFDGEVYNIDELLDGIKLAESFGIIPDFILMNDIEVTDYEKFQSIGKEIVNGEGGFKGSLNGQNHRIIFKASTDPKKKAIIRSNGSYAGLFGSIAENAQVKNLIVVYEKGVKIGDDKTLISGALAGFVNGSDNDIFTNVTVILSDQKQDASKHCPTVGFVIDSTKLGKNLLLITEDLDTYENEKYFAKIIIRKEERITDAELVIDENNEKIIIKGTNNLGLSQADIYSKISNTVGDDEEIAIADLTLGEAYIALFANLEIKTQEEFINFAKEINRKEINIKGLEFKVLDDIYLAKAKSLEPMVDFNAILDVNFKTLTTDKGLFKSINKGAEVKNTIIKFNGAINTPRDDANNYILASQNKGLITNLIILVETDKITMRDNINEAIVYDPNAEFDADNYNNVWLLISQDNIYGGEDALNINGAKWVNFICGVNQDVVSALTIKEESGKIILEGVGVRYYKDRIDATVIPVADTLNINDSFVANTRTVYYIDFSRELTFALVKDIELEYYDSYYSFLKKFYDAIEFSNATIRPSLDEFIGIFENELQFTTTIMQDKRFVVLGGDNKIQAGTCKANTRIGEVEFKWDELGAGTYKIKVLKRKIRIGYYGQSKYGEQTFVQIRLLDPDKDGDFVIKYNLKDLVVDAAGYYKVNDEGYDIEFKAFIRNDYSQAMSSGNVEIEVYNPDNKLIDPVDYKYVVVKNNVITKVTSGKEFRLGEAGPEFKIDLTLPIGINCRLNDAEVWVKDDKGTPVLAKRGNLQYKPEGYEITKIILKIVDDFGNEIDANDLTVEVKFAVGSKVILERGKQITRYIILKDIEITYGEAKTGLVDKLEELDMFIENIDEFDSEAQEKIKAELKLYFIKKGFRKDLDSIKDNRGIDAGNYPLKAESFVGKYRYEVIPAKLLVNKKKIYFEISEVIKMPCYVDVDLDDVLGSRLKYASDLGLVKGDDITALRFEYGLIKNKLGKQDFIIEEMHSFNYELDEDMDIFKDGYGRIIFKDKLYMVPLKLILTVNEEFSKKSGELDPKILPLEYIDENALINEYKYLFKGVDNEDIEIEILLEDNDFDGKFSRDKAGAKDEDKKGSYKINKGNLSLNNDCVELDVKIGEKAKLVVEGGMSDSARATVARVALVALLILIVGAVVIRKIAVFKATKK